MSLTLSLRARTLLSSMAIYGDSTAAGSGASGPSGRWYNVTAADFTPVPTVSAQGVGGQSSATMLAGIAADTAHADWIHLCMDRPNTGETDWVANMASALTYQPRTMIWPPAQNTDGVFNQNIADAQAALLTATFAYHTLDAAAQAQYLAAVADPSTRSDGMHFNDTGQAIQAQFMTAFLTAQNWLPGLVPV